MESLNTFKTFILQVRLKELIHNIQRLKSMFATLPNSPSSALKCEAVETNLTNRACQLQSFESNPFSEDSQQSYKCEKKVSLPKQNKDGANAARTARITLMSMMVEENKKQVMEVLRHLNQDTQIKKLMLNIGQKQFKIRFLLKKEFSQFFDEVFESVSLKHVEGYMRRNKRSQLDYNKRLELSYEYIELYRRQFEQKYKKSQVVIPIPLKPEEYQRYIATKSQRAAIK